MKRAWKNIAAAKLVALLLAIGLVVPVDAAGTIGGRPALPRKDEPRSQSIFIHTVKKNQTASDKILVSNNSDASQTIALYAVDAIPSNTGAFTCKQKVESVTDAGSWISLDRKQVALQPGASDIVDFDITAPGNADVGEHNACIVLETKDDQGEVSGNLRIRTRSAIRVALTIPGTLQREIGLESYDIQVDNYRQSYGVVVKNTGNVSADTDVSVRLQSLFGETIYTNSGQYPVLPGNKLELSFENDKSPFFGGWYVADATVSYDKNAAKWGTQSADSLEVIKAERQIVFLAPQPLAILILLMAVAMVGWALTYALLRRRHRQQVARSWQSYRTKEGDTLVGLAELHAVGWKRLAKVNGLKAPYALKSGQVIRVPRAGTAKKKSIKE